MSSPRQSGFSRRAFRLGVNLWQFAAVGAGVVLVAIALVRTTQSVQRGRASRVRVESAFAQMLADEHAQRYVAAREGSAAPLSVRGNYTSSVAEFERRGRRMVSVRVGHRSGRTLGEFEAEVLDGALPGGLRRPLTILRPPENRIRDRLLATLGPEALDAALVSDEPLPTVDVVYGATSPGRTAANRVAFARDEGVALRYERFGTDQLDYVLRPNVDDEVDLHFGLERLLVLRGNLWIPPDPRPLRIRMDRPGTLVVWGNVYLGRDLEVVDAGGQGASLLVIVRRASEECWAESSGRVVVGLDASDAGRDRAPSIACDASLVVEGPLVVRARPARVRGALVVGGGVELAPGEAALQADGTRLPDPRVRQPGVVVGGGARPGRLQEVSDAVPRAPSGSSAR